MKAKLCIWLVTELEKGKEQNVGEGFTKKEEVVLVLIFEIGELLFCGR